MESAPPFGHLLDSSVSQGAKDAPLDGSRGLSGDALALVLQFLHEPSLPILVGEAHELAKRAERAEEAVQNAALVRLFVDHPIEGALTRLLRDVRVGA